MAKRKYPCHSSISLVPSGPPQNLEMNHITDTVISFSWDPPPAEEQNGEIIVYEWMLRFQLADSSNTNVEMDNVTDTEATIRNLARDTTYTLRVRAYTSIGPGPDTPERNIKTLKGLYPTPVSFV